MIFAHFANSVPLSISAKRPPTSGGLLDAERRNGTGAALRPYFTHFRANSVFGHYASPHYSVISKTPLVIIQFPRIRKLDFVREIVLWNVHREELVYYKEINYGYNYNIFWLRNNDDLQNKVLKLNLFFENSKLLRKFDINVVKYVILNSW